MTSELAEGLANIEEFVDAIERLLPAPQRPLLRGPS
jgi:hypothetical protein